jgi:hypothetical protein
LKVAVSGDGAEHRTLQDACPVKPRRDGSNRAMTGAAKRDANLASCTLLIRLTLPEGTVRNFVCGAGLTITL